MFLHQQSNVKEANATSDSPEAKPVYIKEAAMYVYLNKCTKNMFVFHTFSPCLHIRIHKYCILMNKNICVNHAYI